MSAIKPWEARCTLSTTARGERALMQAEITELREALRVAQEDRNNLVMQNADYLLRLKDMEAKLSAIEAREPELWARYPRTGRNSPPEVTTKKPENVSSWVAFYTAPVAPAHPPYDPIGAWNKGFEEGKRIAEQAQPVNELVEALEAIKTRLKTCCPHIHYVSEVFDSFYIDLIDTALANAKAAQPLTKEQVEKVSEVLMRYRHEVPLGHQPHMIDLKADEAIAILKGVRG